MRTAALRLTKKLTLVQLSDSQEHDVKENQGSQSVPIAPDMPQEVRKVRTIQHDDTTYEVFVGPCRECGSHTTYHVTRSFGASWSVFQISEKDYENVEQYISELHVTFAVDIAAKLLVLRRTVKEFNEKGFFDAAGVHLFRVRMVDKAGLILSRFSKCGIIDHILEHADDLDNDLASAFLLGSLATENHWFEVHHDAVLEGYAHIEGRKAGRPLALAARRRQGRRTRAAVIAAAIELYKEEPDLRRNDSKSAEKISGRRLPQLKKKDGTFLGVDAIIKHLRAARRQKRL